MGVLITLNCPSCGAKIQVDTDKPIQICQYCGSEHIIRHKGPTILLESFARCPKCGRNDKVEKITAILRSHGHDSSIAQSLASPRRPALKPKPETPPKPKNQPKPENQPIPEVILKLKFKEIIKKISLLFGGIILLGIFMFFFLFSIVFLFEGIIGLVITLLIISILPLIGGIKLLKIRSALIKAEKEKLGLLQSLAEEKWDKENTQFNKAWLEENKKIQQAWEEEKLKIHKVWEEENTRIQEQWQGKLKRWDKLYFCHRDDIIFVPGEGTYASVEEMKEYLSVGDK